MKNFDNDLNKVSGGMAWYAPRNSGGKKYYLDDEACAQLEEKGYKINEYMGMDAMNCPRGMYLYNITDAHGNAIGDAAMQELLGSPMR